MGYPIRSHGRGFVPKHCSSHHAYPSAARTELILPPWAVQHLALAQRRTRALIRPGVHYCVHTPVLCSAFRAWGCGAESHRCAHRGYLRCRNRHAVTVPRFQIICVARCQRLLVLCLTFPGVHSSQAFVRILARLLFACLVEIAAGDYRSAGGRLNLFPRREIESQSP